MRCADSRKISVVLAAWKGETYIGEQLRSLFQQTRLPDEILIGDDSPDDATEKAIREILPEAPASIRIDYRKNPQRLGFIANFSALIERASGDYIFLCDQDDIWLNEKIEILSSELDAHPDCALVACNSMRVTADLIPLEPVLSPGRIRCIRRDLEHRRAFPPLWLEGTLFPGHDLAVRKSSMSAALPFPSDLEFHDMWLILFFGIQEKIRYADRILTLYRIHESNVSHPSRRGAGKSLPARLREIRRTREEEFAIQLRKMTLRRDRLLDRLASTPLPPKNLALLQESIRLAQWRLDTMRNPSAFRRIREIVLHLPDYFRYFNGVRSIVRDLFL